MASCTCACEGCWNGRPDCTCPGGPTGDASGSCPIHAWQAPRDSMGERGALDHYVGRGVD